MKLDHKIHLFFLTGIQKGGQSLSAVWHDFGVNIGKNAEGDTGRIHDDSPSKNAG